MDDCINLCNKDENILLTQIKRELEKLMNTTSARLLKQDGKIAELCLYLKDNLKSTLGGMFDTMKENGELDSIITDTILSAVAVLENKTDYIINVKMYGATGDGICDDTEALQKAFDSNEYSTIIIPKGTYKISKTLVVKTNINIQMDRDAEIIANSEMDYMILYNNVNYQGSYERSFNRFIEGGKLNGNFKVKEALLTLQGYLYVTLSNIVFLNFNKTGLRTKLAGTRGNELICHHCYFRNDKDVLGSLAIENDAHDAIFSDIIIRDTQYGVLTRGSTMFTKIHGWIGFKSLVVGSYFIKCLDYTNRISECYSDTYQYSFISCFGPTYVNNSLVLWNTDIYTPELALINPPIVYKSEQDDYGLNALGTFRTYGNIIQSKMPNIQITNRASVYNTFEDHITNYSNIIEKGFYSTNNGLRGGTTIDLNELFEAGCYGINDNIHIPEGVYQFGSLLVMPVMFRDKQFMSNNDLDNMSYCTQIYITTELNPKIYIRNYLFGNWTEWCEIVSGNTIPAKNTQPTTSN